MAERAAAVKLKLGNLRRSGISLQQPLDDVFGGHAFGLGLEVRADAVPQHGDGDLLMSSMATEKRPSIAARALPPLIRNWPARGPAPQSTSSRTNSGAEASLGRVARTSRATYLMMYSLTATELHQLLQVHDRPAGEHFADFRLFVARGRRQDLLFLVAVG